MARTRTQVVRLDEETLARLDALGARMGPLGSSRARVGGALVEAVHDGGDVLRQMVDAAADREAEVRS